MRTPHVILATLALVIVAGCGGPKQTPGTIVPGFALDMHGVTKKVAVPPGTIVITFGKPTTHLTRMDAGDHDVHDADPGTEYVPIHLDFDLDFTRAWIHSPKRSKIRCRTGGVTAALPEAYTVEGDVRTPRGSTKFIVVKKGQPLYIDVTYQGAKTQTVTFRP